MVSVGNSRCYDAIYAFTCHSVNFALSKFTVGMETWWPKAFGCVGRWDLALLMCSVTVPPPVTSLLFIGETNAGGGFPLRASAPGLAIVDLVHIQGCPSSSTGLKPGKFGIYSCIVLGSLAFWVLGATRVCVCVTFTFKPSCQPNRPGNYFIAKKKKKKVEFLRWSVVFQVNPFLFLSQISWGCR